MQRKKTTTPKKRRNFRIFLIVLILIFSSPYILSLFYQEYAVRTYEITSPLISNPVRIMLIADVHNDIIDETQQPFFDLVEEQNPDLILLAGDLIDSDTSYLNTTIFYEKIQKIAPCYYVSGNHEIWTGKYDEILDFIGQYDIKILSNEMEEITIGDTTIAIYGLEDPAYIQYVDRTSYEKFQDMLEDLYASNPSDAFKVLLTHRPEKADFYAAYDFDLVTVGHAHGGQMRIPGILNGLYAPHQGFFPDYAGGEYALTESTTMIVSRGVVVHNTLPRIFNPPEIVNIDLLPE